ncbi:hypothetical protein [Vagococcus xieshaowenii]|uniref:Phage protein n=1 Tax=Vagococcus xieshaowenii TaxID=2562451 RepID=A0AAJ5JLY0_9ENTE|nr:hypothetical protein [Vagococcus xieshaowenii]QCA28255.1 hypothetical protein E4Z98_02590 [Vagococcus xieshaowenii]TFZ41909.1 hypothetical protein E4031_04770 [Vagococcus xieshaowenii]
MSKKTRFKLNYKGVGQLMKSAEMQSVLEEKAKAIKNRCGEGYEQDVFVGKTRANAMVSAKSYKAKKDNSKNNTILKALR